jgi:hypothetical protein
MDCNCFSITLKLQGSFFLQKTEIEYGNVSITINLIFDACAHLRLKRNYLKDKWMIVIYVAPAGIEPASSESESEILSIEIRSQNGMGAKIKDRRGSTKLPCDPLF